MTSDSENQQMAVAAPSGLNALFAGLKGRGANSALDIPTAVMVPIVSAMLADGRVEKEELLQIHAICASSPIYERNSTIENEQLIGRVTHLIQDCGFAQACARAAKTLSPALRETAFVHAVRVVFSDSYVGQQESEIIDQMIEWLGIDRERARLMVEVVSVMQHPASA